ncbi:hypothetical protein LJR175_008170 [Variovorax sp. LjRoot175]|uniref:hypothetical protein n=1 Tax=Variovorax sp. LjRoot175 TaxID=3342276 RepID=UPI003ECF3687
MTAEARDRRLARAMLKHLTYRSPGSNPSPIGISFSNHEDTCEQMDELCEEAGWKPSSLSAQQRVCRAVALRLWQARIVERGRLTNGERDARNEATWQHRYYLPPKWLVRLAPEDWKHLRYRVEEWSTPEQELDMALNRAYPLKEEK